MFIDLNNNLSTIYCVTLTDVENRVAVAAGRKVSFAVMSVICHGGGPNCETAKARGS
jgi:hypothetical protein